MHIPDGLLSLPIATTTAAVSATSVWGALRRLRVGLPRRRIPILGLAAAFIFTAQMLNFPVAAGTSGHLVGGVLAAVLVGPLAAIVVMTSVLIVQCLLFADGGLLALGANILNMGIVAVLGGYGIAWLVYRWLPGTRGLLVATAFGSWCSTVLASICCAAELAWSGIARWDLIFPAMASVHMLIGLGEATIATLVVAAVARTRPDLLAIGTTTGAPRRAGFAVAVGLAASVGLLIFAVPFASSHPDGLERVAGALGFASREVRSPVPSPMADYQIPGFRSAAAATSIAGVVGAVLVFILAWALAGAVAPRFVASRSADRIE